MLELTVDQIKALVSHSALFVWPQMKPGESSQILKACAKLTPEQIAAIETSFSLLYPDKKQAGDVIHIITLCEKLEPEDIISRASSIHSHVAPLVTERMSELTRKEAIQECFTLTPEQIVAFASTDFFSPEKRRVLRIKEVINAYANLTPIQMKAMGKFSTFLLSSEMVREYDFRDIIETCRTLTPEQITDRTQALLENYSRFVLGNMDPYEHLGIMTECLKFPSDKIRALALQADPLLHQCSSAFDVFNQLTVEQIEATGRAAPHLFLKEMDWMGCRSIMEACRVLTPQQIQLRAAAIHSQASHLFNEEMDQRARAGIIEGCLASLSPEQIEAIAPYRALFLPDTFGVWDYPPVIEACAKLTSEQIKEIGIAGSVLLPGPRNSDSRVNMLKMCANLEVDQIRLKAKAIGGFQFPEHIDSYDRANVIEALYKLAVEKIETLSSHRSLFFWEGERLYDNLNKIKACAKLSSAQLAAVNTAFSLLYPEKKKAEDLINFVRQCRELTPEEIQSRAEEIHNNPSLFSSETKGPTKRGPIILACLKLTPEQIHAVALHAASLFLETESIYDRKYKIEACTKMTVDKIEVVAKSAAQFFIEGMEQEAYHTIISECDGLSVEQIKALAVQAPKFFSKKPHKYECRDFVRGCRPLSVDQIDALGEGSPYFLEYFRNLETIVKLYRNSSPDRIRMDAEKYRDKLNKEKQQKLVY